MILRRAIALGLLVVSVIAKTRAQNGPVIGSGAPVTVARAAQYDLTSQLNGTAVSRICLDALRR